jgi:diacylglycerol kinase family enzyme
VGPPARTAAGRLDLLLAGPFSRVGTALMLPRMLAGRHIGHPLVRIEPFTTLEIRSPVDVPLAGDGEPAGTARAWRIAVQPGALRVVRCTDNPARQDQQKQGTA